ncbi:hypothetical protein GCM10010435_78060 [Winogradskya consettensis]|uniref:Uncharacterized protein n=1 Tax=Winogradskya consettensis TaxID=113560 RepID=A0A919VTJ1_9ACTN|nr:hypothetical protein [Actinoplanes consettensis]GIM74830.1 hypothetical protein Aco04nite_42270 [Actinoplanes consettensis]
MADIDRSPEPTVIGSGPSPMTVLLHTPPAVVPISFALSLAAQNSAWGGFFQATAVVALFLSTPAAVHRIFTALSPRRADDAAGGTLTGTFERRRYAEALTAAGRLDAAVPLLTEMHDEGWPAVDLTEVRRTSAQALTVLAERLRIHEAMGRRLAEVTDEQRSPDVTAANRDRLARAADELRNARAAYQAVLDEPITYLRELAGQAELAIAHWDQIRRGADSESRVRRILRDARAAIDNAGTPTTDPDAEVLPTLRAVNELVEKHGPELYR